MARSGSTRAYRGGSPRRRDIVALPATGHEPSEGTAKPYCTVSNVVVALAARLTRIAWALLAGEKRFQPEPAPA